jgi:hypothetical protein
MVGLALLAVCERGPDPRLAAVVPRGFDEQATRERRPGLGDRSLA